MIHKVNRPEFRLVVNSTKSAENDPGSSQGSGVAYEKAPDKDARQDRKEHGNDEEPKTDPSSSQVQFELGELILDFQAARKEPHPNPGLTIQYQKEGSLTKGLLLNKKAE